MKWPLARLGDCCTIVSGATPKTGVDSYWGGSVLWATPKDVSNLDSPWLSDTPDKITEAGYASCSTQMLPAGAVLVSSRAPIGNIAIVAKPMCTNQGFKSLVPGPTVHSAYLYHCMKANSERLQSLGNGATFKEVSKPIVANFEIPLPPLEEQKRIAVILDKADNLRRKRKQAIHLADDFLRALFLDMFGDPATNPKTWPVGIIRDLVASANYGTSEKADKSTGQYPILRMNNLTYEGRLDLRSLKYVDLDEKIAEKYLAHAGDLLFNRTNSKELVGKTAIYDRKDVMAIAGYLVRVRFNERGNPYFVSAYLNSVHGKATLRAMCKSIVGMANINAQEMQNIPIMVPPASLQEKYAGIVKKTRVMESAYSAADVEAGNLFASLSQKFMS